MLHRKLYGNQKRNPLSLNSGEDWNLQMVFLITCCSVELLLSGLREWSYQMTTYLGECDIVHRNHVKSLSYLDMKDTDEWTWSRWRIKGKEVNFMLLKQMLLISVNFHPYIPTRGKDHTYWNSRHLVCDAGLASNLLVACVLNAFLPLHESKGSASPWDKS